MHVFFDIPQVLQISILTQWLSWKEIGRLDSAIVCRLRWSEFRTVIRTENCMFAKLDDDTPLNPPLKWVVSKGIRLRSVRLRDVPWEEMIASLRHFGSALHSLGIYFQSDRYPEWIFTEISAHCSTLTSLTLDGSFLQYCPSLPLQLQSLVLRPNVAILPSTWMREICASPQLTTLSAYNLNYIPDVSHPALQSLACGDVQFCSFFPNITILSIANITAADIVTITQHCKLIQQVHLL